MRNLKRALSLALASVMLLGMMVVGTSASYPDVKATDNEEAIAVMQLLKIMEGDDKGNFNPAKAVTRNEMAVIMANLMDYRVASYKGTSPFTDVPDWAEPYVAACYTNGIISGYSAKTFGGSDPVSTSQAALMLMKALGYFQYQSDFNDDWQLATTKQGTKIELFDDVKSGVKESMTRNDVAQLVLNALKCGTVEAVKNGQDISANGVTITSSVEYKYITSGKDYAKSIDNKLYANTDATQISGSIVQLGEKLYNGDLKLKSEGVRDDFGAPASRWTYKNEEIGVYADSADYTFSGVVKSNAMYDAVGKTAANYTWTVYTDGKEGYLTDADNYQSFNGASGSRATQTAIRDDNKKDLDATTRGSETYVYLNDEGTGTATMVVKKLYVGEITKVKDGTVTVDDMDNGALDFDVEGYKEGDMVLYNKTFDRNYDGEVQAIVGKAELKEGTLETVREKNRIVIDGTTYKYADRFNAVNDGKLDTDSVNEKVSFYLDGQGNIIAFEDTAVSQEYAFVYSVGHASSQYNKGDTDFGAKLVLTDGTVKTVIIDSDDVKDCKDNQGNTSEDKVIEKFGWKVVSYSENDDGTYSLTVKQNGNADVSLAVMNNTNTTATDVIKNGTARINAGTTYYADKNTVYLINEKGDDGDDFNVYVGYNNIPNVDAIGTANNAKLMGKATNDAKDNFGSNDTAASATGCAVYAKDGVAKVVVITDAEVSGSSNDVIFVVGNPTAKTNKTGSTEYYVLDAVVSGEVTSIKVKKGSDAADYMMGNIQKNMSAVQSGEVAVFFGMTKNANGYVTKLTTDTPKDVEVNGKDKNDAGYSFIKTDVVANFEYVGTKRESNGGNLTFATHDQHNAKISLAANDKALIVYYDGEDLSIANRVSTDTDDKALVVTDDGEVIAILVREFDGNNLTHG